MKVTVCQIENAAGTLEQDWRDLVAHVTANRSELVVLPEMVFATWLSARDHVVQAKWAAAVAQHQAWEQRFNELGDVTMIGSQPTIRDRRNHNEAFVWTAQSGLRHVHTKYYLPNEPEYWEATWYRRAPSPTFKAFDAKGVRFGAMLCTDLWFTEHARGFARQKVQIVANPRTTGKDPQRWLIGGQAAAIAAGAFCLSSNHVGNYGNCEMGGGGWIVDPDGIVLGMTSAEAPILTCDIDLSKADTAKSTYPRYVLE